MIASMKKRQSTFIGVVNAVFREIRNGPSHGNTMWSHHTGQFVWLKIIRHRMDDYQKIFRSYFSMYVVHKVRGIPTKKSIEAPGNVIWDHLGKRTAPKSLGVKPLRCFVRMQDPTVLTAMSSLAAC